MKGNLYEVFIQRIRDIEARIKVIKEISGPDSLESKILDSTHSQIPTLEDLTRKKIVLERYITMMQQR